MCSRGLIFFIFHRNKVEQGEHCNAKVAPVLLISVTVIAKQVVASDGKQVHEDEEEEEKVENGTAKGLQQSCHQHLQAPDEGDRSQRAQCA